MPMVLWFVRGRIWFARSGADHVFSVTSGWTMGNWSGRRKGRWDVTFVDAVVVIAIVVLPS